MSSENISPPAPNVATNGHQPPAPTKAAPPPTKPKLPATSNAKPGANSAVNGTSNGLRVLRPETYVGFDSLPDQYVSRVIRDGFGFNILALCATGVGKTTLLEALFNTKLLGDNTTRSHAMSTVSVSTQPLELNEGSIKLKLTLVESKGFGDQIDKCNFVIVLCLPFI